MLTEEGRRARKNVFFLALVGPLLGGCIGGYGYASDFGESLDQTDRLVMVQTAQHALETNKTGESSNWSNPASGHLGSVMPTRIYQTEAGQPCREYQQAVTIGGETRVAYGAACRQPDGSWKNVKSADPAGVYSDWQYAGDRCRYNGYGPPYYGCGYPYYGYRYGYYRYGYPHFAFSFGHGHHFGYGHHFGFGHH